MSKCAIINSKCHVQMCNHQLCGDVRSMTTWQVDGTYYKIVKLQIWWNEEVQNIKVGHEIISYTNSAKLNCTIEIIWVYNNIFSQKTEKYESSQKPVLFEKEELTWLFSRYEKNCMKKVFFCVKLFSCTIRQFLSLGSLFGFFHIF